MGPAQHLANPPQELVHAVGAVELAEGIGLPEEVLVEGVDLGRCQLLQAVPAPTTAESDKYGPIFPRALAQRRGIHLGQIPLQSLVNVHGALVDEFCRGSASAPPGKKSVV